ncbi:hypothetical protein [Bermanella sp. R86510]|uniref:hypothetical protein n=1 Tax=unclassified Bermanella TaxID=2627862 RepID=UPI0037C8AFDC
MESSPPNIHTINFPVGINILAGNSLFVGADISQEPTRYYAEESPMTEYMAPNDYDGDGNIDSTQRGYINEEGIFVADESAQTYGVFLSSYARPDGQPSFMRAIDVQKDYRNKGLLQNLNKDDLMDTDLLVFRESTGQLITERSGLNIEDLRRSGLIDNIVQDGNGNFSYTIAIRSPEDSFAVRSRRFAFDKWQAESKINPALHSQQSDFLRVGEQLRIVAINRATGYMGTVTTELTGTQIGGDVSVYVPPIVMGPPNLKVWATRRYELNGAQAGSDREKRTISNEGAATNDDYLIEVHTQWLDTNGFPLPAGLKGRGFTGRLVKVSADPATTTDPYNTNVQEFAIDPGTQLQVLKFGEGEAGKYHYHVQVSGQTDAENNDFATGNHTGVLRHRPNKYVPVKVPLFDETITNVNKILQQQNNEDAKGTDAAFNWAYRPELSFSVVDLEVSSIQLTDDEDDTLELVDSTDPVISSADSAVEVFFKLMESEFDRITPLDGEQTFILALGEEEIEISASQDESGAITFTNLEHLAHIKPEDYFSIRLYLNEDSQNVLWDWAFKVEGINLITSGDDESRDKQSFIICEVVQANSGTCELQDSIKAELVGSLDDDDIITWKVEALKGNMATDDLDSSSNDTNKPYMYGKTKAHKISAYVNSNWSNIAGQGAGLGRYSEPFQTTNLLYKNAKYFSFKPDMRDEPHLPTGHHTGVKPGTKKTDVWRRNPHIAYKVTATVKGKEYSAVTKMDHKDVIRQEFINHITSEATDITDIITVPARDDLKSKIALGSILAGDWGQPYYDYVYDKHLVLLSTKAKTALNAEPAHTFTVPATTNTDTLSAGNVLSDKLRMNSAWRNPERNERITDNATSRHMVGRAVDLGASGVPLYGSGTTNRAKLLWQLWRAIDDTNSVQNGIQIRWILENADGGDRTSHGGLNSVYLLQGGTAVRSVPSNFDATDRRDSSGALIPDGIPDIFNWASHIHLETMPTRGSGY